MIGQALYITDCNNGFIYQNTSKAIILEFKQCYLRLLTNIFRALSKSTFKIRMLPILMHSPWEVQLRCQFSITTLCFILGSSSFTIWAQGKILDSYYSSCWIVVFIEFRVVYPCLILLYISFNLFLTKIISLLSPGNGTILGWWKKSPVTLCRQSLSGYFGSVYT